MSYPIMVRDGHHFVDKDPHGRRALARCCECGQLLTAETAAEVCPEVTA